jgi:hypothetical protein
MTPGPRRRGPSARGYARRLAPFGVVLLLAACGHGGQTLPPRTAAESSGEPEVARKAAHVRLGRFEQALARRDVERVRLFFSDTLLARQSARETRTLVPHRLLVRRSPRAGRQALRAGRPTRSPWAAGVDDVTNPMLDEVVTRLFVVAGGEPGSLSCRRPSPGRAARLDAP